MKKLGKHRLFRGDCLKKLRKLPDNSVDSVVTDPPYGLSFMGKKWDYDVPSVKIWKECLRVLKPGGYLLAFAGTRTQHRMAVNIEDAGFEICDIIAWCYGSGFPKSQAVGKSIDKLKGLERVVLGPKQFADGSKTRATAGKGEKFKVVGNSGLATAPASEESAQWEGWGSALKPALEPITMARKPREGTIAKNVLKYGTGALNIDGCRVSVANNDNIFVKNPHTKGGFGHAKASVYGKSVGADSYNPAQGRFPANFIHDGSDEVTSLFPYSKDGVAVSRNKKQGQDSGNKVYGKRNVNLKDVSYGGAGSAARFFYVAKANKKDRDEGNNHPTVKPTDLMRYLVRLVTRKGGICLDPFMGSGSTGKACVSEGMIFYGMEKEKESFVTSVRRIRKARRLKKLGGLNQKQKQTSKQTSKHKQTKTRKTKHERSRK